MPISLPNIFHYFQKKKNPTTQHLKTKLCLIFLHTEWNWKAKKSDFPFSSLTNRRCWLLLEPWYSNSLPYPQETDKGEVGRALSLAVGYQVEDSFQLSFITG